MTLSLAQDERDQNEMRRLVHGVERMELPRTLGEFVRLCAEKCGDRLAGNWFDAGATLSYKELDDKADRLASSLLKMGVRKGTHVAVMLGNVPAFPVTWVAIGRIGAVMVPVNTAYQVNDLTFVLSDSDAQFFVVAEEFLPLFHEILDKLSLIAGDRVVVHGGSRHAYRNWSELVETGSPDFPAPAPVGGTDLLNIQYTSGTTGFPKGCMLNHEYWVLLAHFASAPHETARNVRHVLVWQPFFYMDGMWLFLVALRLGATAHVASRMHLTSFYDWLERYEINYCIFPEVALKARPASVRDKRLSLRYISIYGWSRASRDAAERRFGVLARESYGMTEIGLAAMVPNGASTRSKDLTCGLPGPCRRLRIVDEAGRDVPPGQTGELWVAGRSILWGYYKRPEANAKSFDGEWFRTGDVFFRDEQGWYYLVGRSKDMIRRSGENVAAKEVEATLCQMEQVAEAAVVGVPDARRREEVKAFILLRDGHTPESCPPEAVVAHCRRLLAAFKVPRYVVYVDEFPRTPSRKIRKQALVAYAEEKRLPVFDDAAAEPEASVSPGAASCP